MKLPLEEALALGVSEDEYQNFIKDLDEGNRHTQECIEKGIVVTLADPQQDLQKMEENALGVSYETIQKKFAEHMFLEGQNYVLKLTLQEALGLGISEEVYRTFIKDLDEGNRHTQECLENGIEVSLADPQEDLARMRQKSTAETGNVTWEDRFYKSVILPDRINQSISITKIYYRVDVACACNAGYWWILIQDANFGNSSPSSHKFSGSMYSTPSFQFKIGGNAAPLLGGWSCIGTKGAGNGATATVRFSSRIKRIDGQAVHYN